MIGKGQRARQIGRPRARRAIDGQRHIVRQGLPPRRKAERSAAAGTDLDLAAAIDEAIQM